MTLFCVDLKQNSTSGAINESDGFLQDSISAHKKFTLQWSTEHPLVPRGEVATRLSTRPFVSLSRVISVPLFNKRNACC